MGILKKILPPIREDALRQFCYDIGGKFLEGGALQVNKVQACIREHTITFDTYTVAISEYGIIYTRVCAPYIDKDSFRFKIYQKGFGEDIVNSFSLPRIKVGSPEFDNEYIVRSNHAEKTRSLFSNSAIKELVRSQTPFSLEIKKVHPNKECYSKEVELYFEAPTIINDTEHFKMLYRLFAETLAYLSPTETLR
jgi:hypothetical protein